MNLSGILNRAKSLISGSQGFVTIDSQGLTGPGGGYNAPISSSGSVSSSGSILSQPYRPEYQIADGFLLNTYTGDVWKYDEVEKVFKIVQKEETPIYQATKILARALDAEEMKILAQNIVKQESRLVQAISNAAKVLNDTAEASVRNIR